jgi:mRNA interferase MazF
LGLAAKIRPCLVFSVPPELRDRAFIAVVPHTTSVRGTRFEVPTATPFLKTGAFDVQGLLAVVPPRLIRKLGELQQADPSKVEQAVRLWLGI